MSDFEPDLRAALTAQRDAPLRRPASWDDVVTRGRKQQTRHRLATATATLAVAAVAATSLAVLAARDDKPADGGFVAPAPSVSITTPTSPAPSDPPAPEYAMTVRSADGGRKLVAAKSCGPDDRWLAKATDVAGDIQLEVREAKPGEAATPCKGDVFGGAVTVTLPEPLGSRRVLDPQGREVVVVDSHDLLVATYLPQPFRTEDQREELPFPGEPSWSFTWASGDFGVSVHAYGGDRPRECPNPDAVTVRRRQGRACGTTVSWEEGRYLRQVYIGAFEGDPGSMPYTVQDSLRVAEGLRPME